MFQGRAGETLTTGFGGVFFLSVLWQGLCPTRVGAGAGACLPGGGVHCLLS